MKKIEFKIEEIELLLNAIDGHINECIKNCAHCLNAGIGKIDIDLVNIYKFDIEMLIKVREKIDEVNKNE